MFDQETTENSLTFSIKSVLNETEDAIREIQTFVQQTGTRDVGMLRMVVRELLINAVEHGNKKDPEKSIRCSIETIGGNRYRINVTDQGEGFDYSALKFEVADVHQERHRGFVLVNSLTDEIEFEENGASVTIYITLTPKTDFLHEVEGDTQVIRPTGNITANNADQFRELLLSLVEKGCFHFRIDIAAVEDIDSVGLSVMIALSNTLAGKTDDYTLELSNVNEECSELFRIIRLDQIYRTIVSN